MNITCEKCSGKFNFPDEKVPEDRTLTLSCPKCGNKLSVGPRGGAPISTSMGFEEDDERKPSIRFDEKEADSYDDDERPFDFIEEEGLTAIVCVKDEARREKVRIALDLLEYSVTEASDTRDALKNMRYHSYDVVVLDAMFDSRNPDVNGVMIYLNRQPMVTRRHMTVFLMSDTHRTRDEMVGFHKSVNMVVNNRDIDKIDMILQKGVRENSLYYRIYNEFSR
ncbi:zinc-ribbon domain-containing protein [Desulfoluna spongiiphila]|uniref:Zinc-ribbon domain-containing protein n=1 Tax=Desulfoluna spongiiphila TaxID=419481 RepID=A0A1G5BGI6_9BACT|nr:zinc-ribbon domain-containing protein [Desulfoluna spongiiphila]SCX89194.1 zinc-ribbon domain-containing protein [Desulfoluna spongiiphila]VVS93723.1 consensus disorder prediction [Desulfoluna spongiiphila]